MIDISHADAVKSATVYRVISADPPWCPRDKLPGRSRGAARNYRLMTTDQICSFPAESGIRFADTALLALWRLGSMQEDALRVADAWGFRVMTDAVWSKRTKDGKRWFGMGRTLRNSHEIALICVRGSASDLVINNAIRSEFDAPVPTYWDGHPDIGTPLMDEDGEPVLDRKGRVRRVRVGDYIHSGKPDEFFDQILAPLVGTRGPNLEIFARKRRPNWDAIGDELPAKE